MNKTAAWGISAVSVVAFLCGSGPAAAKTIVITPDDPTMQIAQASPPAATTGPAGTMNGPTPGTMNGAKPGATTATPPGAMQAPAGTTTAPSDDADNTKVNKPNRQGGGVTADQQSHKESDREITRQIRKAVTDDDSLSTYAHNIKIVTKNGKVVLKGPVRSNEEKQSIGDKAASVAGAGNVTNSLTIKPKK